MKTETDHKLKDTITPEKDVSNLALVQLDAARRSIRNYEQLKSNSNNNSKTKKTTADDSLKFISEFNDAYLNKPINWQKLVSASESAYYDIPLSYTYFGDVLTTDIPVSLDNEAPAFNSDSMSNAGLSKRQKCA